MEANIPYGTSTQNAIERSLQDHDYERVFYGTYRHDPAGADTVPGGLWSCVAGYWCERSIGITEHWDLLQWTDHADILCTQSHLWTNAWCGQTVSQAATMVSNTWPMQLQSSPKLTSFKETPAVQQLVCGQAKTAYKRIECHIWKLAPNPTLLQTHLNLSPWGLSMAPQGTTLRVSNWITKPLGCVYQHRKLVRFLAGYPFTRLSASIATIVNNKPSF